MGSELDGFYVRRPGRIALHLMPFGEMEGRASARPDLADVERWTVRQATRQVA